MPKGTQAMRMDYRTHIDDVKLSADAEEMAIQTGEEELDRESLAKLNEIAVLKDHPGWKNVQELMEKTIASYRSGQIMSRKSNEVAQMSDAEFGQRMRVCMAVADELESVVAIVQEAAQVVEVEKSHGRRKQGN